jgi:hypothetical protein
MMKISCAWSHPVLKWVVSVPFVLIAECAHAEDGDFCAERPGQTTPPCLLDPGRVMIETAFTSWIFDNHGPERSDSFLLGDSLFRAGLTPSLEAQIGWTPIGIVRVLDKSTGAATTASNTGDLKLGLLYGLTGANGPVAVQGFVSLPVGGDAIGAGVWGAGIRLPIDIDVTHELLIELTPEVDSEVNGTGPGSHLLYGGAFGAGYAISDSLQLGADVAIFRHDEALLASTSATASVFMAWMFSGSTQFDIGIAFGLTNASPNMQASIGIARLF